jgi:hypothetical protein
MIVSKAMLCMLIRTVGGLGSRKVRVSLVISISNHNYSEISKKN